MVNQTLLCICLSGSISIDVFLFVAIIRLRLFIESVAPRQPIIHLPTFEPSRTHPLLLLSICSLVALAEGSESAIRYSERLFEGVRKAILVSSLTSIVGEHGDLEMLQAATIGQTYAFLSGKPIHLFTSRAFHSSLSVSVQTYYRKHVSSKPRVPGDANDPQSWEQWVRGESIIRLLNACYLHNAEVTVTTRQSATMRSDPWKLLFAAPDSLYLAKSSAEWANKRSCEIGARVESRSVLSTCAILACLLAEISHCKIGPFVRLDGNDLIGKAQNELVTWLERFPPIATETSDCATLLMLWHSCFLILLSEVDAVERIPNLDNNDISNTGLEELTRWKSPEITKRCVIHALLVVRLLRCFRVCDVPTLHVARASWQAGLVLAAYAFSGPESEATSNDIELSTYAELQAVRKLGVFDESDWTAVSRDSCPRRCKAAAHIISSTLRSLGPWGDAKHYAADIDKLLAFTDA